jgi:hypothetical protein
MVTDVFRGLAFNDGDIRTHDPRIADPRASFHPVSLGFIRSRDARTRLRHHRSYPDGPTPQLGIEVLFNACEIGIAIDKQRGERTGHRLKLSRFEQNGQPKKVFIRTLFAGFGILGFSSAFSV